MTELQAAIEAAGLPEPTFISSSEPYAEWRIVDGKCSISLSTRFAKGKWSTCRQWMDWECGADLRENPQFEYLDTAAEACAQVRRWMDEQ